MRYAFTFFITIALTAALLAQTGKGGKKPAADTTIPVRPKLIVGIVVDQMRFDYVYRYWDKLGSDGFKRLLSQGYNCRNANFNYVPTFTGPGHASIYTGTTPSVHGIIANNWYDRDKGKTIYCVQDGDVNGVGASAEEGKRSPRRMLSTSVCDQLRLSNNMQSKVIGVALKDRSSVLPAGHTANAAYWYEGASGKFISSTYYMPQLPQWVADFNAKEFPKQYLAQDWSTLLPVEQYTESLPDDNKYEGLFAGESKPVFPHKLSTLSETNGRLGMIRSTPYGNTLTKDFAVAAIQGEQLGKGSATDFLCVSFSSPDYIGHMYGPESVEIEDCYLRLDQELAAFFRFLDNYLGKNNVLVFLTADHGAVEVPQYLLDIKVPAGYFDERMVIDSLQRSLKRKFGDSLVAAYENDQVFFDRRTIAAKGLDKKAIETYTVDFLMQFKGVAACMTASAISENQYTEAPKSLVQRGYNFRRSGDVCLVLEPGWFGEWSRKTGTTHGSPWNYDTHVPLYWWGWKVKNGTSEELYNITDIAPTVCMMMNIQFPDGCTGKPITGLLK